MTARRFDPNVAVGVLALAVFVAWGALDGGFEATVWYAGGLFVIGLLVAAMFGRTTKVPRPTVWAVGFFAAFTAWCFASVSWADVRGDAWDGANRTLLYLVVYALFACLAWRTATAATVFGLFALAVAGVGAVVFLSASVGGDPGRVFLGRRLLEPLGYENANAAFFLMAFWPALFLAGRREVPPVARGLLLGAAGVVLELALLTQSRGAFFAFPVVLLAYFLIVPSRVRSLLALIPVAAVVAVASGPLLDVYELSTDELSSGPVADGAAKAVAVSFVALVGAGVTFALIDRLLPLSDRRARQLNRACGVAGALGVAAVAAVFLFETGNPVARATAAWDEFRAGPMNGSEGSSRFTNLGSNRYDMWRIAWNEFQANPVHGVGVDNFATDQIRERRTNEEPRYPHSLELRLLSQTGVVGALLFAGFLLSAATAIWRARARQTLFARGLAASLVVTFVYWAAHGSIDWFWEFPALGSAAFACLATAGSLGDDDARTPSHVARVAGLVMTVVVAVFSVASFVPPWLAARYVEAATGSWRADPDGAYRALERARRLNFLSDRPDMFMGAIAVRRHEWGRAEHAFERVLERNPKNWYAHLELGVLAAIDGKRKEALAHLASARALNPREPLIALASARVAEGEAITTEELDEAFRRRVENRFGLENEDV